MIRGGTGAGRATALLTGLVLIAICGPARAGPGTARDPALAYFIWAGVRAPPAAARAGTVYLLAGEVRSDDPARLVPLRAVPRLAANGPDVWLTVRTERLDWRSPAYAGLFRALRQWRAAGNRVVGVQIDFDAATRGLSGYRGFLADLRRRLPPDTRLSITGLLDWSAHGDAAALAGLGGTVDEIVVQTYQGRRTIPGYDGYLRTLGRLGMPYRIGVVEDGGWREPAFVRADPHFRGTVIFAVAPRGGGR